MKYLKTYKIFESSVEEQKEYISYICVDIEYTLLKLKEESNMDISVSKFNSNPSEYFININIENCDEIENFTDEIRTLFSYLEGEDWSLEPIKYKADKSYCVIPENPNFICPQCGSEDVNLDIDDDFTTRCENDDCIYLKNQEDTPFEDRERYEGDRDEFRSYFRYFENIDELLEIIYKEPIESMNIKFFKLK